MEITLELGCNKFPRARMLPYYWRMNKEALLRYMETVSKPVTLFMILFDRPYDQLQQVKACLISND